MKCEVIKDLLALYADDACSEQTKAEIEEHLNGCEACSKELEEYKKEINAEATQKVDMDKVKPFRKVAKRIARTSALLIVLIIILGIGVFFVYAQSKGLTVDFSLFKSYYDSKNQTEMLTNGDIDGFMNTVDIYYDYYSMSMFNNTNIEEDVQKQLQVFYDKFIKGKEIDVKIDDPGYGSFSGDRKQRMVIAEIHVKDSPDITIYYAWEYNCCNVYFYATSKDAEDYEKFVNQKLNPLIHIRTKNNYELLNYIDKDSTDADKGYFARSFYTVQMEETPEKNELVNRLKALSNDAEIISFNFEKYRYDKENKQMLVNITFIIKENGTGKGASVTQTVLICADYYVPKDDAHFLTNEGVSESTAKQLLNLF